MFVEEKDVVQDRHPKDKNKKGKILFEKERSSDLEEVHDMVLMGWNHPGTSTLTRTVRFQFRKHKEDAEFVNTYMSRNISITLVVQIQTMIPNTNSMFEQNRGNKLSRLLKPYV